ncbi:hypothetical protein INT46_009571 [Mucor plumbeus]|uniref:Uncharacterized protein n=1 Tax=Mucor plumbeus TaxID=97098 RepID=A0A8H7R9K6_9FUNG|nr:hypothetical protein INT46_009571 [Mucor plumbeus]
MSFATTLFLYATFIISITNFYDVLLAYRNSNAVKFDTVELQTTESDQTDLLKKIHENETIGNTIQIIMNWIGSNKLIPLDFNMNQNYKCHRTLAKNVILQLLSHHHQERLSAIFQDIYGETNVRLANSIAKLALVAIDLDNSTILATLTEVLLTCNGCSVLNFIYFSVSQNPAVGDFKSLPHIFKSMEFKILLITADSYYSNSFKQHDSLQQIDDSSVERIAVGALERINRLQAVAGFIIPTSIHDIACEKSGRRVSNSSTLTSNSDTSSYISPSISSSSSSNTSYTNYAEINNTSNKECRNIFSSDILKPHEASYYDIIKFKTDLLNIKVEAEHLLNQFVIPLASSAKSIRNTDRVKQVYQAFKSLIYICITTESALNNLQFGFAFDQLATQISSRLIDEANWKLHQQSNAKSYNQEDFTELTTSVHKAMDLTSYILHAFANSSIMSDSFKIRYDSLMENFINRCAKLGLAHKSIDTVWKCVIDIKNTIQEGRDNLDMLCYDENTPIHIIKANMITIQSIFSSIYLCNIQKMQPLYEIVKQQVESNSDKKYESEEKIIISMVTSLFEEMYTIKMQVKEVSMELCYLNDKQEFKTNISQAKKWLQAMNYSLGLFIALEVLFSFDSINANQKNLQDRYSNFQENFSEFTLTKYSEICNYFAEDYDTGLNYQKLGDTSLGSKDEEYHLFDDLQLVADQTSELLAYTSQALIQRKEITKYVQTVQTIHESIKSGALLFSSTIEKTTFYEQALAVCKTNFQSIKYPQLNIEGLSNMFYYYNHNLYISLSQTKIDLIDNCLDV